MPMDATLHELIERRWAKRAFERDDVTVISDYVFHRQGATDWTLQQKLGNRLQKGRTDEAQAR